MSKTTWLAASWVLLLVFGCDNLSVPPPDPYTPPNPGAKTGLQPTTRQLNKSFMEEQFGYSANIHETLRRYRDALLSMSRTDNDFFGRRSQFMSQNDEWRLLLQVRQEWLSAGNFGNDHPSRKLTLVNYHLMEEMKHLDNVFLHNQPLDPKFAETTDNAMRDAAKSLEKFQDSPEP